MQGQFDRIDTVLSMVFLMASANNLGVISGPTAQGYEFGVTLFTAGSIAVTLPALVSFAILGVVVTTNETNLQKLDQEYLAAAVATPALMVLLLLSPPLYSFVTANFVVGIVVLFVMGAGYAAISYLA